LENERKPSRGRWRRGAVAAALLCAVAAAEPYSRYVLGLGDPPLYVADPQIEYLLQPDQDVLRFGKRIVVNQWSMRSLPFPRHKAAANELRVMVFGDSVVNGGSQVDHEELATTLLERRLQAQLHRPVIVGNVAAGSWGPGNWLAYVERYGTFDADLVVLVINSGDVADNPTFEPLEPQTHPTRKPWLALQEGWSRYLPRYIPALAGGEQAPPGSMTPSDAQVQRGLQDMRTFLATVRARRAKVLVLHHPDAHELKAGRDEFGKEQARLLCEHLGVPFVEMRADYEAAGSGALYRDSIHPNATGQRAMAEVMFRVLTEHLR
jgi:lysophospholipase L1-like esterase